ncbi:glycoside hydrolase family 43 protein [Kouleothrix sp.]|uniref:glycoside hydrolase family 43 protein n=1 Tax=Kouleothrix sp. TaxID=2779161 RepID=UPI003919B5EC
MEQTYLNPVYSHSFPDPFVLKYCGEYWAYCTGETPDGRRFGVLRSRDLVHWQPLGGAMEPLAEPHPHYWAPEVTYANGRFYMYYSVGDEATMQMRVAVAEHPAGPFADSGRRLTREPFAIDGHVLIDDDGAWYLFYATDFLERSHIGTGTVRDRLIDPFTLAGQPAPVTLPRYDWHVYDPQRAEKGGVRWHTVEGPFVLKHKQRYYQMFSGGNWQNPSYGVSYAVADRADAPGEWRQAADGEAVLPILRTLPGQVIGPGHNSVVRGPDNQQLFCVYHRWSGDLSARVLAIDRLDWAGERMLVLGPSTAPQPVPNSPSFADFFDQRRAGGLGAGWACAGGAWAAGGGEAIQSDAAPLAEATCRAAEAMFVAELSLRALPDTGAPAALEGALGIVLAAGGAPWLRFGLLPQAGHARVWRQNGAAPLEIALPAGFDFAAYHLARAELNGGSVTISLDGRALYRGAAPPGAPSTIGLYTQGCAAAFAGFALTAGWEDCFEEEGTELAALGWHGAEGDDGWSLRERQLWFSGARPHAALAKGPLPAAYELVVNARLAGPLAPGGGYGCYPAARPGDLGPLLAIEQGAAGWVLAAGAERQLFELPGFDAASPQQLRLRKRGDRLEIWWEARWLGEIAVPAEATQVGLYAHLAAAAFDMVRVTAL